MAYVSEHLAQVTGRYPSLNLQIKTFRKAVQVNQRLQFSTSPWSLQKEDNKDTSHPYIPLRPVTHCAVDAMSQTQTSRPESLDEQDPHKNKDADKKPKSRRPASMKQPYLSQSAGRGDNNTLLIEEHLLMMLSDV